MSAELAAVTQLNERFLRDYPHEAARSLEKLSVECGRATGDVTFPIIWMPEYHKAEFASKVADMRNSVKDRMNASSSAAGVFIHNHIEDTGKPWLHLDIAGPAFGERAHGVSPKGGTGFGVATGVRFLETLASNG